MGPPRFERVLITGASSGLGRGLALHYAREGSVVYALARREAELDALASEAAAASGVGGRVVPVPLDATDAEALAGAISRAEAEAAGALDLVIANAGTAATTPARRADWREVKRVLDLNVSAACVTVAAALPAMVARGAGTVAAVASLAAFRGLPGHGAYCASKAALHTFMESVRVDLAGTGVRAVTIYPGFVKTPMTEKNRFPMPFLQELDDAVRVMARGISRGRPTVVFPPGLAAIAQALRLLPRALYEPVAGAGGRRRRRPRPAGSAG